MKIAIIQAKLAFADVEANYQFIEQAIKQAAMAAPDVIMLPEMWNTSFFPECVRALADKDGERTKAFLGKLASQLGLNIVGGSVATRRGDKLFNTAYVYNRQGELVSSYDKVHLFSPTGEDTVFEAGEQMGLFELDGVPCGLAICYDLRFAEWIRMYGLQGVAVMFLPAAWPQARVLHWNILNRARAIENQFFMICANSVGSANDVTFGGNSAIIDPWGEYLITPDDQEGIKTGEIDLSVLDDIRARMAIFNDRKRHLYRV